MSDASDPELFAAFARACELAGEARAAFLAELEAGTPALARELRALLAADESGAGALDEGLPAQLVAAAFERASSAPPEPLPARIGRYRVLRLLGRGGMGDVYLARQEQGIEREVALKVIRLGMDSAELVQRFHQERQALALLDHPHVAQILEAGVDERGRPYFAMELALGEPLVAHCDRRGLGLDARLALFLQVCDAVEHAHRRGILHRDLKPSNVLATEAEGCKVIDFGVAKLVDPELHSVGSASSESRLLGTPAYMAPEQAGASDDVDTRADVYSLGVMLYELLTGARPADEALRSATSLSGMLRVVREHEPERPSVRRPGLPVDLDWIALRALEKDRERRYRSPAELAADLERFRRHEPVSARPPSTGYRLRKLARRHRGAVASAATVLAALVLVLAATSALYVRSVRAERRFHAANDELRRLADIELVREAERAASALGPIEPASSVACEAWLERYARPLSERRALHAARLAALRDAAIPLSAADEARERAEHPLADALESAQELRAHWLDPAVQARNTGWALQLERISAELARLEPEVAARRTWRFAERRDQWEHDSLAELDAALARCFDPDPYRGLVAGVERRIAECARIEAATRAALADGAWAAASAAIRASPRYGGLELAPERGLVPLGPDPRSGLFEFWHVASGSRPRASADPDARDRFELAPETGLVLVLIPGGVYRLGAQALEPSQPHHDPLARADEHVHELELWPFFLAKHELTLAQWKRATGSEILPADYDDLPAHELTWLESVRLIALLDLALPTEAQWEAAARGGTETPWWCGASTSSLEGCANVADLTARDMYGRLPWIYSDELEDGWPKLAPVGSFRANAFGLHDVAGNVLEWCADPYLVAGWTARAGDGLHLTPRGAHASERSARGGGWQRPAASARAAEREAFELETRLAYLGLRPARPLDRHRAALPALDPEVDGADEPR